MEIAAEAKKPKWIRLTAWLELFRIPNLFTVPGDPVAGFFLAGAGASFSIHSGKLASAVGISLLCYCSGLLQNDFFDAREDGRDRPHRPIPSGRVEAAPVAVAACVTAVLGLLIGFSVGPLTGFVTTALVLAIFSYNYGVKKIPIAGPLNMGLCRGLSLLLGASVWGEQAFSSSTALSSACFLCVLIAWITGIASVETESYRLGKTRWAPATTVAAWFATVFFLRPMAGGTELLFFAAVASLAIFQSCRCALGLQEGAPPAAVQRTIGCFIRGLLPVQAALTLVAGPVSYPFSFALLALWPVSKRVSRRFYAS